ncbi:cysteine protease domain-containing protein [Cyclospora cayetanensis]|uniref:Ubiquitin thioesterase OTU n=1 Tax=Cyclospora cayetanensis TaxID=88456 RepID=A0A1D3D7V2_9EIME|nr:cysteine protease domain-containing protein [Cyclospora cayetanensis]
MFLFVGAPLSFSRSCALLRDVEEGGPPAEILGELALPDAALPREECVIMSPLAPILLLFALLSLQRAPAAARRLAGYSREACLERLQHQSPFQKQRPPLSAPCRGALGFECCRTLSQQASLPHRREGFSRPPPNYAAASCGFSRRNRLLLCAAVPLLLSAVCLFRAFARRSVLWGTWLLAPRERRSQKGKLGDAEASTAAQSFILQQLLLQAAAPTAWETYPDWSPLTFELEGFPLRLRARQGMPHCKQTRGASLRLYAFLSGSFCQPLSIAAGALAVNAPSRRTSACGCSCRGMESTGDGACLFASVAAALWVVSFGVHAAFRSEALCRAAHSLRKLAVDTLTDVSVHSFVIEGPESVSREALLRLAAQQFGCSPQEYCRCMRERTTWGGGPEILALAHALGRPIAVYTLESGEKPAEGSRNCRTAASVLQRAPPQQILLALLQSRQSRLPEGRQQPSRRLQLCKVFGWTEGCQKAPLHLLFTNAQSLAGEHGTPEANHFTPLHPEPLQRNAAAFLIPDAQGVC